jgi:hypothetical protein
MRNESRNYFFVFLAWRFSFSVFCAGFFSMLFFAFLSLDANILTSPQFRRGSAGRMVAIPSSSTSTTYRPGSAPLMKRLKPFGRRKTIAWVPVRVSIA